MGPSQGSQTVVSNSTPFNASQLLDYQNKAINLSNNNPFSYYPGQTYAPQNENQTNALNWQELLNQQSGMQTTAYVPPAQIAGLQGAASIAGGNGVAGGASAVNQLYNLGMTNPTQSGMSALSPAANGSYLQGVQPYASGLQGLTSGTAANSLAKTANGDYLGQNPYIAAQFNAAAQPLTRQFMTATAPQTDSAMESAGRYNSGALQNQRSVNQRDLGDALGNLSSNLYGQDYANERNLMGQAASQLGNLQTNALSAGGQLYNTGANTAAQAASNLGLLGYYGQNSQVNANTGGLTGYNNLLNNQVAGINAVPGVSGLSQTDFQNALTAGTAQQTLQQNQINDLMQRYYGNIAVPWQTLTNEASIIGSPIPGMSTQTSPLNGPSPFQQITGGLGAAGGLASGIAALAAL